MYCWKCGKENHDESRFCTSCGAELRRAAQETASRGTAAPSSASSAGAQGQSAPEQAKKAKKNRDWTYFLVAAVCVIVSIVNINDMNSGSSYTVILGGIPIQYVLLPAGVISLIAGIMEKKKK